MAAERIIGIDFGTSTSFVKVKRYEDGKPAGGDRYETKAVVFDGSSSMALPTVIQKAGDQYWYGFDAESMKPGGTVYRNFKVDLENSDTEKRELARSLTKQFFKYIYQKYDEQRQFFGDKTDTEKTLVSYPAKWSEGTARFMVEAAKEAGFQNVSGFDEATAAINTVMVQKADELLEKGYLKEGKPVTLMLLDMGAGTTDIAVCRYTAGSTPKNEIVATWPKADGDILFGGREVDEILCEYLTKKLRENGLVENVVQSLQKLKMGEIKAWKEYTVSDALSRDAKVEYCTVLDGLYMIMGITPPPFTAINRSFFESLAGDYLKKFAELINGCIEHTKSVAPDFKASDISLVVLTGGHSQWYFAEQILTGKLKNIGEVDLPLLQRDDGRVIRMARPQETVSIGLAYGFVSEDIANSSTADSIVNEGSWIYYINDSDDDQLYKISTDGTMKTKLSDDDDGFISTFTIKDGWIYTGNEDGLCKIRTDGTIKEYLEGATSKLTVVGDWIYYINYDENDSLYKMRTDGSKEKEITDDEVWDFAISNDWIYYINQNDDDNLYRIRSDGTKKTQLTKEGTNFSQKLCIIGDWIYYLNSDSEMCKVRTDGSINMHMKIVGHFIIHDDWIYYCELNLKKTRTDGTMATDICDDMGNIASVSGGWVYYYNVEDDFSLYKIRIDGSMRTKIIDDKIKYLKVIGDWIYYMNEDDGDSLYKIRTDGAMRAKLTDDTIQYIYADNLNDEWIRFA